MILKSMWGIVLVLIIAFAVVILLLPKQMQKSTNTNKSYQGNYVAIGDSISAGVGLPKDSDPSACDRTNSSYPYLISKLYNIKQINLSCSGAATNLGLLNSQNVNNLLLKPQLQTMFSLAKPRLITLTIGANDAHWNEIISQCYLGNCNQDLNNQVFQANLAVLSDNLNKVYSNIADHYRSEVPNLIVTGYFEPLPTTSSDCLDVKNLNTGQLVWLRGLGEQLNYTLQQSVTNYKFASFVPLSFTGHELCSLNSWVQGLTDSYPYHPTVEGQQAISSTISAKLNNLNYRVYKQ
jgi:lysophospholipase L1-like esterase